MLTLEFSSVKFFLIEDGGEACPIHVSTSSTTPDQHPIFLYSLRIEKESHFEIILSRFLTLTANTF